MNTFVIKIHMLRSESPCIDEETHTPHGVQVMHIRTLVVALFFAKDNL